MVSGNDKYPERSYGHVESEFPQTIKRCTVCQRYMCRFVSVVIQASKTIHVLTFFKRHLLLIMRKQSTFTE